MTFDSLQDESHLFFITASICGWKPILSDKKCSKIILEGLETYRKNSTISLFAFVIMPTYFHAIIKPLECTIGGFLRRFGSLTAHKILQELKNSKAVDLLEFFHESRSESKTKYLIWQDIQAKNIHSKDFLEQKLEYIHNNPISERWNLVKDRADYSLSSARKYDREDTLVLEIDDIRDYLNSIN